MKRLNQFARILAQSERDMLHCAECGKPTQNHALICDRCAPDYETLDLGPFMIVPGERVIAREVQGKRQRIAYARKRAKECAEARARFA